MKKPSKDLTAVDGIRKQAETCLLKDSSAAKESPHIKVKELIEGPHVQQGETHAQNEELRRAYEELEKAKKIYSNLFNLAPVGYITVDNNDLIVRVNPAGAELLGQGKTRLIGERFSRFIPPDFLDIYFSHIKRCLGTEEKLRCELKLVGYNKDPRYIILESVAFSDDKGIFNRILSAMIDITDRKITDDRIKELNQELLKSQEIERQKISLELHDSIAQDLSAVKMGFDTIILGHPEIPSEIKQKSSDLSKILERSIIAVRDLSYNLLPPDLQDGNIIRCLSNFCREFATKTGIDVEFFSAGMETCVLDDLTMINIYRIVQEGLYNIKKHAEAGHAVIRFSHAPPYVMLKIEDNGKGFDMEKRRVSLTSEKRIGLRSMEERVRLLGGSMRIKSKLMRGTEIIIRLYHRG